MPVQEVSESFLLFVTPYDKLRWHAHPGNLK